MGQYKQNLSRDKSAPNSWCPLPWTHIAVQTNGFYRLCCYTYSSGAPGNYGVLRDNNKRNSHISTSEWEDLLNNEQMKSIRKTMLKGQWPKECIRCQNENKAQIESHNFEQRKKLAKFETYPNYLKAKAKTQKDGSISLKDFPISYLDIRFGNLCNLKCVMCNPSSSSKWFEDWQFLTDQTEFNDTGESIQIKKINGKWNTEKNIYNWSEDPLFWSQIEKHISNVNLIYFAGGEPLLIKSHLNLLEKCIEKNTAEKTHLSYSSNITYIPDKVWNLWKHFKSVLIVASLDGLGKVNDLIRHPSQWNQIEKNILKLDRAENLKISVNTTISSLNIWHIPQFIQYIMQSNYKRIDAHIGRPTLFHLNFLDGPKFLTLSILEDNFKEKIMKHFKTYQNKFSHFDWLTHYGESRLYSWEEKIKSANQILNQCIKFLYHNYMSEEELLKNRKRFIGYMDKLDQIRNTSWAEVLPELYENTVGWRKL